MSGFTSNIINLITDNLRDRYHNGFPVIKELVQNADDAKASRFVFGVHPGFPTCKHPLLQGAGLWCFNNGEFKPEDKRHIRSFAENAKAGEDSTIGKFGLGMKSVFHLCEAFFYIAYDGKDTHPEFLNPWDDGDKEFKHPHMDWDTAWNEHHKADTSYIKQAFADYLDTEKHWFLLWIPLRCKAHLQADDGEEYGSLINSFPGDNPEVELNFLKDNHLAEKLGGLLPLLKNLQEIRFVATGLDRDNWKSHEFQVSLRTEHRMNLINTDVITSTGEIVTATAQGEQVWPVWGRRIRNTQTDSLFYQLKQDSRWPKTRYRDGKGRQQTASDKSSAESAVLISHQSDTSGGLTLQWAVFLPLEEESHIVFIPIEDGLRHYRIVLHGQFFIDAGRRGIHDFKNLQHKLEADNDITDEQALRSVWNRALAQQISLPLVLPALEEYVRTHQLKDNEVGKLTTALKKAIDRFGYVNFITTEYSWFRELLLPSGGQWCLYKNSDSAKILPLPAPPQDSTKRPWEVLPCLAELQNTLFVDKDSAALSKNHYQWSEESILAILRNPAAHLFAEAAQLDYFDDFLKIISPQLGSSNVKQALLKFIREAISHHGQQRLRNNKTKISRVLEHLPTEKRWRFGAVEEKSQSNISDDILKALWQCESEILPIPAFLDSNDKSAQGKPTKQVAEQWLRSLQRFDSNSTLNLIKTILQSLEPKNDRLLLIKSNQDLKIVSAYDAKRGSDRAVSYRELSNANEKSLLFSFAGMSKHDGIQLLEKCLSNQVILAIRSDDHKLLFESEQLPKEDENEAILTALIKSKTALIDDIKIRKELLKKCHYINESNTDAKQGLRYLLHANFDQKINASATLWIKAHDQSSAWEKLQRKLIGNNHWQVIDSELVNVLPRNTWEIIGIKEIKPDEMLKELKEQKDITLLKAEDFSSDERNEILNKIDDKNLWCRLPWHKTIGGHWASIEANTYLKTSVELPDSLKDDISIIEPVSEIAEKQKWITKLDDKVAISIALDSDKSSEYNKEILTWLGKDKLNPELQEKLKSTKWLLLKNNQVLSPNDIIVIVGLEDAIQKLAASASYAYASDKDLNDSIIHHFAFDKKVKPLLATEPKDILEKLALLMNEVSAYAIGSLCESDDIGKLAKTLADCEFAPSWGIIKAIVDKFTLDDCKHHLLDKLEGSPEKEALINIFDWLQKKNTQQAQAAYAFYLRQMVVAGYAEELLPQIKLLAKDGKSWKLASELCIDAPGVDDAFVLCDEQRSILIEYLQSGTFESTKSNSSTRQIIIKDYLKILEGRIKLPLLGLLAALLKVDSNLVNHYLSPNSVDTVYKILSWQAPDMQAFNASARQAIKEKWDSTEFAFTCGFNFDFLENRSQENETCTADLLGNNKAFPLRKTINKLVIKRTSFTFDQLNSQVSTTLYLWGTDKLDNNDESLVLAIKNTCEWLWTELYCQYSQSLHQLWDKLSETHQLDIAVTRSVILKHAAFYLNTLGANKEDELRKALSDVENAETRLAEAENNEDKDKQVEWQKKAKEHQEGLIKTLQNNDAAQHILEKVQSKLREFQYEPDSILFELFQNADDAVLQLARCESFPDKKIEIVEQCQHFRIIVRDNTIYAMHWGRPINDRCSTEAQERWPGYGKDLEKMLILSASDKPDDKAVTGRFGLGFKSVFLACDAPKIISGDLRVNIVAGFLPEVWKEAENAQSLLRSYTENPRYSGTLVALPLRQGIQPDALLNRFKQQQALLCMTSKMLRHISIGESSFTWSPKLLGLNKKLEFGKLDNKNYLVYRDEIEERFAAVVMRVSARGFELLKDETPSFWVVAPTRETASIGFIISAPFQIDAGRGKLAGEGDHDKQNQKLVEQLGEKMGYALAQLYQVDWEELLPQLGLAEDVSKAEWWTSLWKQFKKFDWDKNAAPFHLANIFVKNLLLKWSSETGMIPNGQVATQAEIVSCQSVRYNMPENWLKPDALKELQCWTEFTQNYSTNSLVSQWMTNLLRKIGFGSEITDLGLNHLLELINEKRCTPQIAAILGKFIATAYDTANTQLSETDKKQLHDAELKFLAKDETYQPTDKLLIASSKNKNNKEVIKKDEEQLRADFAPDKNVLFDQHSEKADSFFKLCRKQMGCADELEKWFISASAEKQEAALRYLIEGSNGDKIADVVSNKKQGKWFDNVSVDQITKNWKPEDQNKLKKTLQSNIEVETGRSASNPPAQQNSIPEKLTSLKEIYTWWKTYGAQEHQSKYLNFLYPNGTPPNLRFDNNGNYDRESWMLLLGIGIYQRLGRTRDFQTKGFLEYFQSKGWWQILCTSPDEDRDAWIRLLYEYSQDQQFDAKYSHWMTMFPDLFKVSLYLDQYVPILEGLQHRTENEILLARTPNLDRSLQGAGFGYIPPIDKTLGKGFNLIVRELLRLGVIDNTAAHPYAYMPVPRVKKILERCEGIDIEKLESSKHIHKVSSKHIHKVLCESLGETGAIFDGDYDIPFLVLAHDKKLLKEVTQIDLPEEPEEEI